ncbi:unnamed protein product [Calypogeia fissa]
MARKMARRSGCRPAREAGMHNRWVGWNPDSCLAGLCFLGSFLAMRETIERGKILVPSTYCGTVEGKLGIGGKQEGSGGARAQEGDGSGNPGDGDMYSRARVAPCPSGRGGLWMQEGLDSLGAH